MTSIGSWSAYQTGGQAGTGSSKVQSTETATYTPPPLSMGSAASGNPRNEQQRNAAINWQTTIILAADNTPTACPPLHVPPGTAVRVRANNGTTAGNTAVIFVADYPEKFARGQGTPLAPLDDVLWPANSVGHIWVYGKTGDGLVISVVTPQQ